MKIFDLRIEKLPWRQGEFATLQVRQCPVCHALTNVIRHYPRPPMLGGAQMCYECPNGGECWHHELNRKIEWLHAKPHPIPYRQALELEIEQARKSTESRRKNDLRGNPDTSQSADAWYGIHEEYFSESNEDCPHEFEWFFED